MKRSVTIPLWSLYSLFEQMETAKNDPKTAELFEHLQSTLGTLKEAFMPLIDEFKDCNNMPDIVAEIDTDDVDSENNESNVIDWEQRRYELIKAAMQARIPNIDSNFNYKAVMPNIAYESIKMADTLINELKTEG